MFGRDDMLIKMRIMVNRCTTGRARVHLFSSGGYMANLPGQDTFIYDDAFSSGEVCKFDFTPLPVL